MSTIIAETALAISTQRLMFAGQPVLLHTNSPKIARYAREFLSEDRDTKSRLTSASASITIHARNGVDDVCNGAPHFRARGAFGHIRFTSADSFWFNLHAREVFGTCSQQLADDCRRWHAHIFPALLGTLSASIDVAPVHAACLALGNDGLLLAGPSGAGKSTLTIAMARRGFGLLADDWTYLSEGNGFIERGINAWGLPVPIKLLPDAHLFFRELLAYRTNLSLNSEMAYEVFPESCFGVVRTPRCRVRTVVLLQRSTRTGCSILPIKAEEAARHLQAEVEPLDGKLAHCHQKQLDIIRHAVDNASCYRFLFNDHPDRVAGALEEALARMS